MSNAGYYRYPTLHNETVVFVSEDDLWRVPTGGGEARRLTSNRGEVTSPMLSPDGSQVAFVGREEGAPDIYVMPATGGPEHRLTFLASIMHIVGWDETGQHILFATNYGQMVRGEMSLFQVPVEGVNGQVESLSFGFARSITFGPNGGVVLGRNTNDSARRKRYRGGTTGHLWIDRQSTGEFSRFLSDLDGNIASPMWLTVNGAERVFFGSDHEGIGNLYSCTPAGTDVRRHTDHEDYYVRNPSTDGQRIVYHAGADLFLYDPAADRSAKIDVTYHSPRVQRNRKFAHASRYIDSARLHPTGDAMAVTARGKSFAFFNFDGPVLQHGKREGVRYRLADWLNDSRRLVMISDDPGEEVLEIHDTTPGGQVVQLDGLDIGRAVSLRVSPTEDKVALTNHRHELLLVDLNERTVTLVDHSPYRRIAGLDWSPDGKWLAYGYGSTPQKTEIRLYNLHVEDHADDETEPLPNPISVTQPVLHDAQPAFDPAGRYLYFLSEREFNPVFDGLHLDLGFPWGMRPYLLTLQADLPNPFVPHPEQGDDEDDDDDHDAAPAGDDNHGNEDEDESLESDSQDDDAEGDESDVTDAVVMAALDQAADAGATASPAQGQDTGASAASSSEADSAGDKSAPADRIQIDLDGIERRIFAFPVQDGRYGRIAGIKGKALFSEFPIHGMLDGENDWDDEDELEAGALRVWDFKEYKSSTLVEDVRWFNLSRDRSKLIYGVAGRLRVIAAGEKPASERGHPRKTGWVNLNRIKVSIDPQSEWEQMFREAWRLQRDQFWTEDMSSVDWQEVYRRYFPLIERVSSRSEFSDLMWEMQGELGTSHAYEYGGDYRPCPYYGQGHLGAQVTWDAEAQGYRIGEIVQGDPWNARATSPLAEPAMDIQPGDLLCAINGQLLDAETGPAQLLVNLALEEVLLTFADRQESANGDAGTATAESQEAEPAAKTRSVVVRTLADERPARYRAWVEENRRRAHAASAGRVGYVHIPDMGPNGYAEFHRGYLAEIDRDALIIDVRYNGGGYVSQLILEKLARRRIGYDLSRWGGMMPYPLESVAGPLVALTNEHAGSDGDIFCHSFKLMKLGPLIGKRTWGGVIGIYPRHTLVDGTVTTQPEFSLWFEDVGWHLENYGTEPDIEIDISPQDYVHGRDPQLERAIVESLRLLDETQILKPDMASRPNRALPKLPPRSSD